MPAVGRIRIPQQLCGFPRDSFPLMALTTGPQVVRTLSARNHLKGLKWNGMRKSELLYLKNRFWRNNTNLELTLEDFSVCKNIQHIVKGTCAFCRAAARESFCHCFGSATKLFPFNILTANDIDRRCSSEGGYILCNFMGRNEKFTNYRAQRAREQESAMKTKQYE